jgi:hypothetical protein
MLMKNPSHRRQKAVGRSRLRRNQSARYPIERSPLWSLSSIHRLAELLGVAVQDVEAICTAPSYNRFDDQPKPGKEARHIQEPTETSQEIHYRIALGQCPSIDQLRGRVASARAVEPLAAERLESRLKKITIALSSSSRKLTPK